MVSKWFLKYVSKWFQNGFKLVSKWYQNWFKMVSEWFLKGLKDGLKIV